MGELLFMVSTVLAGLLACLSRPGCPAHWSCVKPGRLDELAPLPLVEQDLAEEPEDAHGFSDGLAPNMLA
jgi:hypothetical protein